MKGTTSTALEYLTEDELDALSDFLDSDATPDACMDLSMLHGFLTAIQLTPKEPDGSVWLPEIWGENGERPRFASLEEEQRIIDLVLKLYNQLASQIGGDEAFEPLVYQNEAQTHDIAEPWCYGFLQGIALTPTSWDALLDQEEVAEVLQPVFDCADEEVRTTMQEDGEDLDEFEHALVSALPEIVATVSANRQAVSRTRRSRR
ncbi:YecA/YgfB family protein [Chitinibacteraceae bacterium HSL-7]